MLAAMLLPWGAARAEQLIADLSRHLVAITTGFTGADVLLFGAAEGGGDVVVVVRGPPQSTTVRRKERIIGLWVNQDSMVFPNAPSFYHVAATRPLPVIASPEVLKQLGLGVDNLPLDAPGTDPEERNFREALVRNMQRAGLYGTAVGEVTLIGERLFRSPLRLPANVLTGSYEVDVMHFQDGRLVSIVRTPLIVERDGVGAEVFEFSARHAAAYGLIAIVVAGMAGWAGGILFRKA